jgi:peptidylprolyl isomerase
VECAAIEAGGAVIEQRGEQATDALLPLRLLQASIVIDMAQDAAPNHVAQITALAQEGAYDGVVFHRVIEGFMAQTGDVEFGRQGGDMSMAGMGGSSKPDLGAEFSSLTFDRGVVGMARSMDPNSANSQFFIMFAPASSLDGQYTIWGEVTGGMDAVDKIKRGSGGSGMVQGPDRIRSMKVTADNA